VQIAKIPCRFPHNREFGCLRQVRSGLRPPPACSSRALPLEPRQVEYWRHVCPVIVREFSRPGTRCGVRREPRTVLGCLMRALVVQINCQGIGDIYRFDVAHASRCPESASEKPECRFGCAAATSAAVSPRTCGAIARQPAGCTCYCGSPAAWRASPRVAAKAGAQSTPENWRL
jgi:hypothetical protein